MRKRGLVSLGCCLLITVLVAGAARAADVDPFGRRTSPGGTDPGAFLDQLFNEETVRTVCFRSMSDLGIDFRWTLEADPDPVARMATVTGGFIGGGICDAPNWTVTGGSIDPASLSLMATYTGSGGACTMSMDLSGARKPGTRCWMGSYCWDDGTCYPHTTCAVAPGPCR